VQHRSPPLFFFFHLISTHQENHAMFVAHVHLLCNSNLFFVTESNLAQKKTPYTYDYDQPRLMNHQYHEA